MHNMYVYIFIMAGVSFLIRILPLTVIHKKIESRFLRSFLYYVPYVTIAVMTFPAIIYTTGSTLLGFLVLFVGVIAAYLGAGLFPVAILCSLVCFAVNFILQSV